MPNNLLSPPPLIIDLGKKSRKKIKQLKQGKGVYLEEVEPAIARARASLSQEDSGKEIIAVVVIYEKKPKRVRLPFPLGLA